ncbi:MAG: B12-binding domain-containing radical SAM protein [Candidatus Bathyarchaeota archaeon]|nr:B12-binding domain-containing radical SAM protein [Candidatus Bathyarchaeota archaeon]
MPLGEKRRLKIALISPPPASQWAFVDYQNPTIGLAYLAAVLEKEGHEVKVFDCPPLHVDYSQIKQVIGRFLPDMVGITSVTATFNSALKVAQIAKQAHPNAFVVLGGPHVTIADDSFILLHPEVDVVVKGEGEQTILDLAAYVSGKRNLQDVVGITFAKNGQLTHTPNRPCIQNLDDLPFPAWHLFPLIKYRIFHKIGVPMLTSRGCGSNCSFCLIPRTAGTTFRARTPASVAKEMEYVKQQYHADFVTFNDEIFTYDKEHVLGICQEIKQRKIKLPWDCQTRPDLISKELLQTMKSANCQSINFGIESGSQKMLNIMRKPATVEQNTLAISWAKEAGLSVTVSLVLGYPGETQETLMQTIDFIKKNKPDDLYLFLATPFPSTPLRDAVTDLGWKMSQDWNSYEMQTASFENPLIPFEQINKAREIFYNQLYSPQYIIRHWFKGTIYSKVMVENGLHQLLWRFKLPWLSSNFKRLVRL